ncbi:MAG: neutral zinc metallopeptidase [Burkholderiales bacterium]
MRWGDMRRSDNVDDRQGAGGGGRSPLGGGVKLSGIGIVLAIIAALVFGVDPMQFLGIGGPAIEAPAPSRTGAPGAGSAPPTGPAADVRKDFSARIVGDTEDVWRALFQAMGIERYPATTLTLYRGAVRSACGSATSAAGPFYCPADARVYLDTGFFDELARRFGAPGDFAQAYVIAHEVGHHVQNTLGTMKMFDREAQRLDERRRNALSIRLELQADCYAGVWGHFAQRRNLLEPGDLEEGLRAAAAVGDDTIMKRTQGYVVPDAMNHGTAEQRMRWFKVGLASGDPRKCDTFATAQP